jgi:hypothetical protein
MESTTTSEATMQTGCECTKQQWEALRAEAATMALTCPYCAKRDLTVRASFKIATRQEGPIFLGFHAFCPACQFEIPADNAQLALSA